MSDDDLIRRVDALDAVGALYVAAKYPQDRENNATVDAAIVAVRALPADPYAAAAIRLAEASLAHMKSTRECEDEDVSTCDCEECEMIRAMREFAAAREARK